MLETKDLTKIYKPKKGVPVTALNKISIKFAEKGMVFLLGKSGSGKSTLLNVLGGLDSYNGGEIIIKGVSSKAFSQKHFDSYRNTYVGFIFQEYNVIDEFTVGANIALAIELQGRKADDNEINRILKEVDLEGYGSRKPNELSGGQKQRVAIARALVKNPRIIMADEPTGALDSATGRQVLETLKKLSEEKLVIVVSHDREFAEKYADRIIELSDGVVINDVERVTSDQQSSEETSDLTFSGDTVEIKADYHLTEQDRIEINQYIDNLKGKNLKLKFGSEGSDGVSFTKTDENGIIYKDKSPFKLIKSKLPLKSAIKIGSGGLKYKKIRLTVTILLSCIAFGLFGLSDTFGAYNHIETCTNSLEDSNVEYIATAKSKRIGSGINTYWRDYGYNLSQADLDEIEKNTGVEMHGVYVPVESNLTFETQINPEKVMSETDYNIFKTTFSGFAEINDDIIKKMGFSLLAGTIPDGSKNEIAISEYIFEVFKKADYIESGTNGDSNESAELKYTQIKQYSDILGKTLNIAGTEYVITAVVDTNFDLDRYLPLTEKNDHLTDAETLVNFVLYNEFSTSSAYSYTNIIMTGDGFIKRLIAERPPMSSITEGYIYFYADEMDVNPNYLARFEDVSDEDIIWIDGPKTELKENEIIATSDAVHIWAEDYEETDYIKLLKDKDFTVSKDIFAEENMENKDGYKVVGIIQNDDKSSLLSTVVCNDELYNQMTEGKDYYYSFCVGSAPDKRSDLKKMVEYCYSEEDDVRYQIQNSVTFELDSINEVLKTFSKVFLYIGLGFAVFAAIMLANFISTSISYKKQEIGILRAIGSRSNDVFRIFFSESSIIAMINFVLSAIGVFAATVFINYIIRDRLGVLVTVLNFGIRQVVLLFAVSVFVAFLSSYIPVKKIASKRPIDAIRDR